MDMGWTNDPYESFRIFQGKVLQQYDRLRKSFGFIVIDAKKEIHEQQAEVRRVIGEKVDLRAFRVNQCR
jgi:dTMP kinase